MSRSPLAERRGDRATFVAMTQSLHYRAIVVARIVAWLTAALVLVQGALAGSFMSGTASALAGHRTVGTYVLMFLSIVLIGAAVVLFGKRRWILPASVIGFLLLGAQIGTGFTDRVVVHVPLGVALFGMYLVMALLLRDDAVV